MAPCGRRKIKAYFTLSMLQILPHSTKWTSWNMAQHFSSWICRELQMSTKCGTMPWVQLHWEKTAIQSRECQETTSNMPLAKRGQRLQLRGHEGWAPHGWSSSERTHELLHGVQLSSKLGNTQRSGPSWSEYHLSEWAEGARTLMIHRQLARFCKELYNFARCCKMLVRICRMFVRCV